MTKCPPLSDNSGESVVVAERRATALVPPAGGAWGGCGPRDVSGYMRDSVNGYVCVPGAPSQPAANEDSSEPASVTASQV